MINAPSGRSRQAQQVMRRSFLFLIFVFLSVITVIQTLGAVWRWYSPFLMALGIIVLAALIQQKPNHDEL